MEAIEVEKSIVDWAIDHPQSVVVFQQYSIDYCCAGKSLEYACQQAGASLPEVVAKLREVLETGGRPPRHESLERS